MASDSDFPDPASFLERLFSSRNRENLPMFLPFMLSLASPQNSSTPNETSTNSDQNNPQHPRERLILVNPFTQTMLVIERRSSDRSDRNSGDDDSVFDSWINDLFFRKEGQPPASKASMDAMPEVEIREEGKECVICLEELEVGLMGKEMPCKHGFHGGCIEKWLKIHGSCPVCRYKMPVEERNDTIEKSEEDESGSGGRREVWMGFTFGDDDGRSTRRSGENHQSSTESSTESGDVNSTSLSGTDLD